MYSKSDGILTKCEKCGAHHSIGKHFHATGLTIEEIEERLPTDGEYEDRYKGVRLVFD